MCHYPLAPEHHHPVNPLKQTTLNTNNPLKQTTLNTTVTIKGLRYIQTNTVGVITPHTRYTPFYLKR
jgi:hypothetical protein